MNLKVQVHWYCITRNPETGPKNGVEYSRVALSAGIAVEGPRTYETLVFQLLSDEVTAMNSILFVAVLTLPGD